MDTQTEETPEPERAPDEVANRPDPADVPDADLAEPLPEETGDEEGGDEASQGSGDRPETPGEGSYPPGNPDVDPERMDQAAEDLERTKPY